MRIILVSVVLATLIAIGGFMALFRAQEPVYEAQPQPTVRIGDPGHNLVGPDWSGNVQVGADGASSRATAEPAGTRTQRGQEAF